MTFAAVLAGAGLLGALLSAVSLAVAGASLRRHRRRGRGDAATEFTPPVSIVKPLSGLDDELARNLESFYRLDYPEYEIVFSFARETDPAYAVARRAADAHPDIRTVFVFDPREAGLNAKVNRLAAGVRRARYGYFLFSDGNVRVRPDFLRRAMSFFSDSRVGLVSNLFAAAGAVTLGSRIESLHLNGFLQAGTAFLVEALGRTCVVGKSILMSREALNAIGGFAPLRDHLAEDFLLGERTRDAGYAVRLSADEVDTAEVGKSLRSAWARHRRWAILRVRLGGISYASEILASPALWVAAAMTGAVLLGGSTGLAVAGAAAVLWIGRTGVEASLAADAGRRIAFRDLPLVAARDAAVAVLFWAGLVGRRTAWRGRELSVGAKTLLERVPMNIRVKLAMAE
jgi:ceramide glucosyltransferase